MIATHQEPTRGTLDERHVVVVHLDVRLEFLPFGGQINTRQPSDGLCGAKRSPACPLSRFLGNIFGSELLRTAQSVGLGSWTGSFENEGIWREIKHSRDGVVTGIDLRV